MNLRASGLGLEYDNSKARSQNWISNQIRTQASNPWWEGHLAASKVSNTTTNKRAAAEQLIAIAWTRRWLEARLRGVKRESKEWLWREPSARVRHLTSEAPLSSLWSSSHLKHFALSEISCVSHVARNSGLLRKTFIIYLFRKQIHTRHHNTPTQIITLIHLPEFNFLHTLLPLPLTTNNPTPLVLHT